jgi:uncharacterized protein YgiM (DUF1202 family)
MKMKYWLVLAATLSMVLVTQQLFSDEQPVLPAEAVPSTGHTNKQPAKGAAKNKKPAASAKKTAPASKSRAAEPEKPAPVTEPGPAVVTQPNVNVRGQAAINSDVVAHLKRGDHVTVLEEVTLKRPKTDEPAKWARIALPTNTTVWVNASFIDAANKTVVPKKLKLRSGPGENYSVLGIIQKGSAVNAIESKGDWMRIEPPAEASAFVAAHLLAKAPAAPPVVIAKTETPKPLPPPTETAVAVVPPPATATDPAATVPPAAPPPLAVVETPTPPPPPPAPEPPPEEILVKRVVSREGVVRNTVSIQAPTYFKLESLDTGKTINYLHALSTNIVLRDFNGKRIIVTGEELLDERWPNTPVISIESLEMVP